MFLQHVLPVDWWKESIKQFFWPWRRVAGRGLGQADEENAGGSPHSQCPVLSSSMRELGTGWSGQRITSESKEAPWQDTAPGQPK